MKKVRTVPTTKLLAGALVAAASTASAPAIAGDPSALLALRGELQSQTEAQAMARLSHFRPPCDKDGYPLVGNLITKGPSGYQPSAFCAAFRKARSAS